jgi:hypothetical protein
MKEEEKMSVVSRKENWISIYGSPLLISLLVLLRILYLFIVFFSTSTADWQAWTESPDSSGYIALAEDLQDFRLDSLSYRTPGYAVVIAILNMVEFGDLHLKVLVLQQILDGLVAYLIYRIMLTKYTKIAIVPAVLYLLHPYALSYSSLILPATFAGFFVIIVSYILLQTKSLSIIKAAIIGVLLSLGTMVRPMLLYSSLMMSTYILWINRKHLKKIILPVFVLLLSSSIIPSMMKQYNKTQFGMNAISSQGSFEIAARIAVISGYSPQEKIFRGGGFKDSIEAMSFRNGQIDYQVRDSIYTAVARELFKRNPFPVVRAHLFGWLGFLRLGNPQIRYFCQDDDAIDSPFNRALQLYVLACSFIMYPGILLGIFQRQNRYARNLSIIALLWFAYISVIHAALCGPYYFTPILGLLLAAGISGWNVYIESKL